MGPRAYFVLMALAVGPFAACLDPLPATSAATPFEEYTKPVFQPVAGIVEHVANASEYYVVSLTGSANATRLSGPGAPPPHNRCVAPWRFTLERYDQTLTYNRTRFTPTASELTGVVAENFWGVKLAPRAITEGCPTDYDLVFLAPTASQPYPRGVVRIGAYGAANLSIYPNGNVAFDDRYFLEMGKRLMMSFGRIVDVDGASYYVQGGFELLNLGAWPKAGLVSGSGGTTTRG